MSRQDLKERIINEMVITEEDRMVFSILREYPEFNEQKVREIYKKFVGELL